MLWHAGYGFDYVSDRLLKTRVSPNDYRAIVVPPTAHMPDLTFVRLLDLAAVQTFLNSGTVYAVPQQEVPWLLTIARNVCSTWYRSRSRRSAHEWPQDLDSVQHRLAGPERGIGCHRGDAQQRRH